MRTFAKSNQNFWRIVKKTALRKSLKIASITLAVIVGFLLVISLIVNFGPVQNRLVDEATKALQEKIPTKVSIDNIRVNLFNQEVSICGIEVDDLQNRKMLQLDILSADFKFLPLFSGKIVLEGGEIEGLKALIVKPSKEEPANYQFLIDAFQKKDGKDKETKKDSIKRFAIDLSHIKLYDIVPVSIS